MDEGRGRNGQTAVSVGEASRADSRRTELITMRAQCKQCGSENGYVEARGGQDCVFCNGCGKHSYNRPRTESGKAKRSVSTTHAAIKPKQRRRILERANGCCEICRASNQILHVGHVVSVVDGHSVGLTDTELNGDENLIAECEECNLGNGRRTMPIRLLMAILKARSNSG